MTKMNTLKFLVVVAIVLLSTGLVYHQIVNGQTENIIKNCTIYNDSKLVVVNLDSPCTSPMTAIAYYSGQGYEIKAVVSTSMFMQKVQ